MMDKKRDSSHFGGSEFEVSGYEVNDKYVYHNLVKPGLESQTNPRKSICSENSEPEKNYVSFQAGKPQNSEGQSDQLFLHSTTPPDTRQNSRYQALSPRKKIKGREISKGIELFQVPLVTNPTPSEKELPEKIILKDLATENQGWVTTEAIFKSNSLAETTIDRLTSTKDKLSSADPNIIVESFVKSQDYHRHTPSPENTQSVQHQAPLLQNKNITPSLIKRSQSKDQYHLDRDESFRTHQFDPGSSHPAVLAGDVFSCAEDQTSQLGLKEEYRTEVENHSNYISASYKKTNKSIVDNPSKKDLKSSCDLMDNEKTFYGEKNETRLNNEHLHLSKKSTIFLEYKYPKIPSSSQATCLEEEDNDEFDQGIDDVDFLAIVSDTDILSQSCMKSDINQTGASTPQSNASPKLLSINEKNINPNIENESAFVQISEKDEEAAQGQDGEICEISTFEHNTMEALGASSRSHYISDNQILSEGVNDGMLKYSSNKESTFMSNNQADQLSRDEFNSHVLKANNTFADSPLLDQKRDQAILHSTSPVKTDLEILQANSNSNSNQRIELAITKSKTQINLISTTKRDQTCEGNLTSRLTFSCINPILEDSHEFNDPGPFARPEFPTLTKDCSTIIGLSSDHVLRVCFRIGEMFKEAGRFSAMRQVPVIELFARVTYSWREPVTSRQFFQFADMWHNRPPFPNGLLVNYRATDLVDAESIDFVNSNERLLARVLGTLKKDRKQPTGSLLYILNIRKTDWEEINWTRRIVSDSRAISGESRI